MTTIERPDGRTDRAGTTSPVDDVPPAPSSRSRRAARVVVALAAAVAALLGVAFAATSQLYSSGDEAAHVDYAYQVWSGELPVFEDGLVIEPGFGFQPPVQWVAQHPPLYYLLQAPAVGPSIDSGRHVAAGYTARGVNAALAALVVVASAWAAAQVAPRRPTVWAGVALVTALNAWVVRVAGSVYNDLLCVLWSTLLLGLTARALRRGPTWRTDALLAVVGAAALATRASLAVVIGVCGLALLGQRLARRDVGGAARILFVGVVAVLPTVPFYLRNLALTGRVMGGDPQWAEQNLGSASRPVLDVVADPATWRGFGGLFSIFGLPTSTTTRVLLVVPTLLAVGAAVAVAVLRHRRPRVPDVPRSTAPGGLAVVLVLAGVTAAVVAMQVVYTAGGGGLNPRYLMPVLLPVTLVVAAGLDVPRVREVLLAAWCAVAVADVVLWAARTHGDEVVGVAPTFPLVAAGALLAAILLVPVALGAHGRLVRAVTEETR